MRGGYLASYPFPLTVKLKLPKLVKNIGLRSSYPRKNESVESMHTQIIEESRLLQNCKKMKINRFTFGLFGYNLTQMIKK
ncbi:hypothetical protein VINI7043_24852 [Vibrio nigripulchritudo ATCC 27043]|nr:hypothetical protein VINI7043_24852 [Vibrio nigripulchritudo ATCC 27043]